MQQKLFKKQELKKKNFYAWLKQVLVDHGWENISSKPSTDFDVFYSKGESGKDELFFQMKEYTSTSTNDNLSGSVERFFDVKLLKKYTPGLPGQAGILDRSNEAFQRLQISTSTISLNADMTVYYNINKNRIIMMTEFPVGLGEHSVLNMIGRPNEHLSKYYPDGSMMTFTTTSLNGISLAVDEADGTRKSSFAMESLEMIAPKARNSSGMYFMSELAVKTSNDIKAVIEGVYVVPTDSAYNNSSNRGDILVDKDGNKYRMFYLATRTSSSYPYYLPTRSMALMIE